MQIRRLAGGWQNIVESTNVTPRPSVVRILPAELESTSSGVKEPKMWKEKKEHPHLPPSQVKRLKEYQRGLWWHLNAHSHPDLHKEFAKWFDKRNIPKMELVRKKMKKLDAREYEMLIQAHGEAGLVKLTFSLYNEMKKAQYKPGTWVYKSLLYSMLNNKDPAPQFIERCGKLLSIMDRDGIKVDVSMFNLFVSICHHVGDTNSAKLYQAGSCTIPGPCTHHRNGKTWY